jgi:nucleoid DNA-binding protein
MKDELIQEIAKTLETSQAQAEKTLDTVLLALRQKIMAARRVALADFGIFEIKTRKARLSRNPRTGEKIEVPAKHYVKFKTSKRYQTEIDQLPHS